MKNRGKSLKTERNKSDFASDSNNFSSPLSDRLCKKHPSNSPVGICAYCVSEKLIKLVCSDCGEHRLSSCSCYCSDFSSYRNSSCTVDVGRISFLIDNEKSSDIDEPKTLFSHFKLKQSETECSVLFKRSSSVVEVKKRNGFWKIGKFFKKKKDKESGGGGSSESNRVKLDQKSDVSRSRSLSSFMGDRFHNEVCSIACSSAKISDCNESEPRKSGFKGGLVDFEGGFPVKETDFSRMEDDDEFIDLKIDSCDKSKTEHSVFKKYDQVDLSGNSDDGGIKKIKNSHMQAWKWVFKHQSGNNDHNFTC